MVRVQIKQDQIEKGYQVIKAGGLAIIPSRVGYTLLGNSETAIHKMFELKGRPLTKPCVVLTRRDILEDIAELPEKYKPFVDAIEKEKLLCGFILKRKGHHFFDSLSDYTAQYSQKENNTSCFVINASDYIQYLVDQSVLDGTFVVGSSANKSGTGNEGIFTNIPQNIREGVDFAIEDDNYVHQEYNPETREQGVMIDLTGDQPVVTRKGLRFAYIKQILDQTVSL